MALGHFLHPLRDTAGRVARLALGFAVLFTWHWYTVYVPLGRVSGYGHPALDGAVNFLKANGVTGKFLQPKAQYYLNIVLDPNTDKERLVVWGAPKSVCEALDEFMQSPLYEGADIFDPKKGHNFEVIRKGNPQVISSIEYVVQIHPKSTVLKNDDFFEGQAAHLTDFILLNPESQLSKLG